MFAMLISLPSWRRICQAGLGEGGADAGGRGKRSVKETGGADTEGLRKVWWDQGIGRQRGIGRGKWRGGEEGQAGKTRGRDGCSGKNGTVKGERDQ